MPFLHFNPPDSGKDAYENSLALLYRPVSVISEIWLPQNFTSKEITIMEFNYTTERRRKFERNWAKTEALYRKHSMSEAAIQKMREYDWDLFKAARIEAMHTQEMGFYSDDDDDKSMMDSPLLKKFFEQFTTQYDTYGTHSRYWWLEELGDVRLVAVVPQLTTDDKELLTLYFVEQYTTREIADKYGTEVSHR